MPPGQIWAIASVLLVNDKFNWLAFEGLFEDLHCCNATDATSSYDYSNWSWFSDAFFRVLVWQWHSVSVGRVAIWLCGGGDHLERERSAFKQQEKTKKVQVDPGTSQSSLNKR
jgi:hypothetical protein